MIARPTVLALIGALLATASHAAGPNDRRHTEDLSRQVANIAAVAQLGELPAAEVGNMAKGPYAMTPAMLGVLQGKKTAPILKLGAATGAGEVDSVKVDFVLAQLRMQMGANYHLQLRQALPSREAPTLFVRGGRMTLKELTAAAAKVDPQAIVAEDGGFVAHWPIIVWSDAELVLEPGDDLRLDDANGVFLFNAGLLRADGATVTGLGNGNARQEKYRPFITTALTGGMQVSGTHFSNLGFDGYSAMEGVSLIGGAIFPSKIRSYVVGSVFDNAGTLTFRNAKNLVLRGNTFRAMSGPAIELNRVDHARIADNLISGTLKSHGISLKGGTSDAVITSNVVIDNGGSGVFAANGTRKLTISDNLLAGNRQGGVGLVRSVCADLAGNTVFRNGQSGIKLRQTSSVTISGNDLVGNDGMAVSVVQQPMSGDLSISDNVFDGNKSGLFGAAVRSVALTGNDFSAQMPILFDGELARFVPALLKADTGLQGADMTLTGNPLPSQMDVSGISPYGLETCDLGDRS
ncbi:right-handed parallel beta-helix repeat-containing protein [Rhizobium sp. PAMB 3182]